MGNTNEKNQKPTQAPGQKPQNPNEKKDMPRKQSGGTQNPGQPQKNR